MEKRTEAAQRPEHRVYLRLQGRELTTLLVSGGKSGKYFVMELPSAPEERLQLSALLTALSCVPFFSQVYVHTTVAALRDMLRRPVREYPREVRDLMAQRSLLVRGGTINRLEAFWQDILAHQSGAGLPEISPLSDYHLHTYAVTDGLSTHAAALLYGHGEMHLHDVRLRGEALVEAELKLTAWAFELVAPGKTVDVRHHHPVSRDFWNDARPVIEQLPQLHTVTTQIGRLMEKKQLRFNLPDAMKDDTLARAVRWYTGRCLA